MTKSPMTYRFLTALAVSCCGISCLQVVQPMKEIPGASTTTGAGETSGTTGTTAGTTGTTSTTGTTAGTTGTTSTTGTTAGTTGTTAGTTGVSGTTGGTTGPGATVGAPNGSVACTQGTCLPALIGTNESVIYDVNGAPVTLKGINWSGFEAGTYNGLPPHDMVLGLYDTSTSPYLTQDFLANLYRMKLLGFNAVRLPFAFDRADASLIADALAFINGPNSNLMKINDYQAQGSTNPYPKVATVTQSTLWACSGAFPAASDFQSNLTPTGGFVTYPVTAPFPALSGFVNALNGLTYDGQHCNSNIAAASGGDTASYIARYASVVNYLVHNGFYVILDNHGNVIPGDFMLKDLSDASNDVVNGTDYQIFATLWANFFNKIMATSPDLEGRVLVDIANEVDCATVLTPTGAVQTDASGVGKYCGNNKAKARGNYPNGTAVNLNPGFLWEPDTYGHRFGMHQVYLSTMQAITKSGAHPNTLFLVEGLGQLFLSNDWGDGFATDANALAASAAMNVNGQPDSDPSGFFNDLITNNASLVSKVIISPHLYPFSITGDSGTPKGPLKADPATLTQRLNTSFGYLAATGFAGKKFPIVIGEIGADWPLAAAPAGTSSTFSDTAMMTNFANYFTHSDAGHPVIPNWFWWEWAHDSGDTAGLVSSGTGSQGPKSLGIRWDKMQWLGCYPGSPGLGLRPWFVADKDATGCDAYNNTPVHSK